MLDPDILGLENVTSVRIVCL